MTATNQMSTTDEPPTEEPPRQPAIIRRRRNAVGPPDTSTERPLLAAATARRRLRSAQIDGGHRRRGWIDKRRSAVDVAAVIAALNALAATTVDRTGSADRATVDSAIRCRVASSRGRCQLCRSRVHSALLQSAECRSHAMLVMSNRCNRRPSSTNRAQDLPTRIAQP